VRGDAGALNSPNRAQGSRYWKGATVHICLRVDQASIPLGHSTGQCWYQVGYSFDASHRIPVWQRSRWGMPKAA
jgi:hypothetical protein